MSEIADDIAKSEDKARVALDGLRGAPDGWPLTEMDWEWLRIKANELSFACQNRRSLLAIQAAHRTTPGT